jgi:hypothetical protein
MIVYHQTSPLSRYYSGGSTVLFYVENSCLLTENRHTTSCMEVTCKQNTSVTTGTAIHGSERSWVSVSPSDPSLVFLELDDVLQSSSQPSKPYSSSSSLMGYHRLQAPSVSAHEIEPLRREAKRDMVNTNLHHRFTVHQSRPWPSCRPTLGAFGPCLSGERTNRNLMVKK